MSTRASGSAYARSSRASPDPADPRQPAIRRDSRADSPVRVPARALALVEGFRGDVLAWVRLSEDGAVDALPPARPLLVPVAAAGSGYRGQHRRRLPALQQILQLLLFRARPVGMNMRRASVRKACAAAADRSGARRPTEAGIGRARAAVERGGATAPRPQPVDPRGRRRLVQRLRAGNPCAQQCVLRSRALRLPLRRLAAPRRCPAGHRPGDQEHARALARTYDATPEPKWVVAVGDCALDGGFSREATHRRRRRGVVPVDLHIPGCPPRPADLLKGLLAH